MFYRVQISPSPAPSKDFLVPNVNTATVRRPCSTGSFYNPHKSEGTGSGQLDGLLRIPLLASDEAVVRSCFPLVLQRAPPPAYRAGTLRGKWVSTLDPCPGHRAVQSTHRNERGSPWRTPCRSHASFTIRETGAALTPGQFRLWAKVRVRTGLSPP